MTLAVTVAVTEKVTAGWMRGTNFWEKLIKLNGGLLFLTQLLLDVKVHFSTMTALAK